MNWVFCRSTKIGKLALTVLVERQGRLDLSKGHNPPEQPTTLLPTAGNDGFQKWFGGGMIWLRFAAWAYAVGSLEVLVGARNKPLAHEVD